MVGHFTHHDYEKLQERLNPRFESITRELLDTLGRYAADSHHWIHLKEGWQLTIQWLQSPQRWPEVDTFDNLERPTGRKVLYVNGEDYAKLSRDQLNRYPFIVIKGAVPQFLLGTHLQALQETLEVQPDGILQIQKYATGKDSHTWDERAATVGSERISAMVACQEQRVNKPLIRDSDEPWRYRLPWNFLNLDGHVLDPVASPAAIHKSLRTLFTLCQELKRRLSPTFGFGKPYDQPERGTFFADVESCLRFVILGEKGTFSGNHTDILAGTWILSLCGLKLWWIFTGDFNEEAKENFIRNRASWNPGGGAMQVLPLEPGDYLLMMPGHMCAHAPFSMEDCLMTGGMFWNEDMLPALLENIAWICEHNARVSNEGVPRQLIAILEVLRQRKSTSPEVIAAVDQIEKRLRPALSCQCAEKSGECGADCACANPVGHSGKQIAINEVWWRSSGCTRWCGCTCQKKGLDHGKPTKRGRPKNPESTKTAKRPTKKVRAEGETNSSTKQSRPYVRRTVQKPNTPATNEVHNNIGLEENPEPNPIKFHFEQYHGLIAKETSKAPMESIPQRGPIVFVETATEHVPPGKYVTEDVNEPPEWHASSEKYAAQDIAETSTEHVSLGDLVARAVLVPTESIKQEEVQSVDKPQGRMVP
jgi:hypothetical protein